LAGKVLARDIVDETTGEVLAPCNKEIAPEEIDEFFSKSQETKN